MFYTVEVEPYSLLNNSSVHVQSHVHKCLYSSTSYVEPTVILFLDLA